MRMLISAGLGGFIPRGTLDRRRTELIVLTFSSVAVWYDDHTVVDADF